MHHNVEMPQEAEAHKKKEAKNSLGISKGVYSAGMTVAVGFLWTAIIWAATFVTLQFGDKLPIPGAKGLIGKAREGIKWVHDQKYGSKPIIEWLYPKFNNGRPAPQGGSAIGTTAFLSFVLASLLSHFFQVKGAREGYIAATKAINLHDATVAREAKLESQLAQCQGVSVEDIRAQIPPVTTADSVEQYLRECRNQPAPNTTANPQQPKIYTQDMEQKTSSIRAGEMDEQHIQDKKERLECLRQNGELTPPQESIYTRRVGSVTPVTSSRDARTPIQEADRRDPAMVGATFQ